MQLTIQILQTLALIGIAAGTWMLAKFLIPLFKQQLANKQTEVDTLKAQVSHLESLAAPALADQLKKLAPLVNEYAKKAQELEAQLQTMSSGANDAIQISFRLGVGHALLEGIGLVMKMGLTLTPEQFKGIETQIEQLLEPMITGLIDTIAGKELKLAEADRALKTMQENFPNYFAIVNQNPPKS
jgi:hypothetical protein